MKCQNCQAENAKEALFCGSCGKPLQIAVEPADAKSVAQPKAVAVAAKAAPTTVAATTAVTAAATAAVTTVAAEPVNRIANAYPHSEGMADFARYQRKLNDKADQVKSAKESVYWAETEYEALKKRRRNCVVAGVVCVALIGSTMFASIAHSITDPISFALVAVFLGVNLFFIPFGLTPVKNFINNHGFFIVFSWMFLAMAAVVLVMLAVFIGLPYAIWLNSKISQAEKDLDATTQHAQRLQVEYQAM